MCSSGYFTNTCELDDIEDVYYGIIGVLQFVWSVWLLTLPITNTAVADINMLYSYSRLKSAPESKTHQIEEKKRTLSPAPLIASTDIYIINVITPERIHEEEEN